MIREITTTVTRTVELVPAVAGEQQEKHVLTVRDYSSFGRSRCPQINMTGKWLEKAGFAAGDRVTGQRGKEQAGDREAGRRKHTAWNTQLRKLSIILRVFLHGKQSVVRIIIQMCLVCLLMLKLPGDVILFSVFYQFRPGLMIGKADIIHDPPYIPGQRNPLSCNVY